MRVERINGRLCVIDEQERIFPIVMGGAEDEGKEGEEEEGAEGESESEEEEESEEGKEEIRDPGARIAALEDQVGRLNKNLKKSQKEIQARDKALKEHDDAKKTDDQKLVDRIEAAEKRNSELEEEVKELRTERMIFSHDRLAKLPAKQREIIINNVIRDLEIDEDGDSNLEDLLKDLEKDVPILFKVEEGEEEEEEETPEKKPGGRPVKPARKDKGRDDESLRKRFPALRR